MKYNKRRTKILELLDINEKMSYTQLAESLDVSQATIRRDLVFLEKEHAIERYWGGAKRTRNVTVRTRSIMAVSYTHLDVYKRQGLNWCLWSAQGRCLRL